MTNANVLSWSSDIDWITATIKQDTPLATRSLWAKAISEAVKATARLPEPRPWGWMGYHGLEHGGIAHGAREDTSIVRASSECAAALWRLLPLRAINVTRLDVALTLWLDRDAEKWTFDALESADKQRQKAPKNRQRKLTHIDGRGAGNTLYIGSRTSVAMGRMYDKWRESKDETYKFAWRFEIEYKPPDALHAYRYFREAARPSYAMASTARTWFEQRGVAIPGEDFGPDRFRSPPALRTSDDERALRWLAVQVAPTVERLACTVGREQVELALGLRESL